MESWQSLNRGEFTLGEFKRVGKGGREVWIHASYNPIFDPSGRVFKVVKYATEVTGRVVAVETVKQALLKLETGNLDTDIDIVLDEQFVVLKDAINHMVAELRYVVDSVNHVSGQMTVSEKLKWAVSW